MNVLLDPDHRRALRLSERLGLEKWALETESAQRVGFDHTRDYRDAHLLQGCEPTWFWLQQHDVIHRGDWQTLSLAEPIAMVGANAPMQAAASAPQAQMAAFVDSAGAIFLFDMERGRVVNEGSTRHRIAHASLSPDGRYLALCNQDSGQVVVWARREGSYMLQEHLRGLDRRLASHRPAPASQLWRTAVVFDPMGEHLLLVETAEVDHEAFPPGWRSNVLLFEMHSGRFLWASPIDANLTGDGRELAAIDLAGGLLSLPAFSPDGRQIVLGSSAGAVVILDALDGAFQRHAHAGTTATLSQMAIGASGRCMAARTVEGQLLDLSAIL